MEQCCVDFIEKKIKISVRMEMARLIKIQPKDVLIWYASCQAVEINVL
jgi:hypothetical protein